MMQLSAKSASHHGVHQRKFAAWLCGIDKFSSQLRHLPDLVDFQAACLALQR
jgi:hypothetical protein